MMTLKELSSLNMLGVRASKLTGGFVTPILFVRCHLDYMVFYAWNAYFRFGGNNDVVRILRFLD